MARMLRSFRNFGILNTLFQRAADRFQKISGDQPPGFAYREPAQSAFFLDKSAELFKEREFGAWALPPEIARPHLEALADMNKSGLVLSKEVAAERFTTILDTALEAFVAGPMRPILVRRMEEMAYLFHVLERERPARLSLAVAIALSHPEGRTMKEISFLRAFVFRAFIPSMTRDRGAHDHAHDDAHDHDHDHAAAEVAEGSSIILDPSKVREKGVQGAGRVDDIAVPGMIIRP